MSNQFPVSVLQRQFAAHSPRQKAKKRPSPFPIRLSDDERAYLENLAGALALGSYMRQELLKDFDKVQTRPRRKMRQPLPEEKDIGKILAKLGETRIYSNLNQLTKHANMGTLDVSEETEEQIIEACSAVFFIRDVLVKTQGLRSIDKA